VESRDGKNVYTGFVEHRHPGNDESRPAVSIAFEVIERLNDAEGFDLLIPTVDGIEEIGWAYDPRVCKIDDEYVITWCNKFEQCPTIGIATTQDFKTFEQQGNAFLPYNRNGVMFPRKINGKYAMLSRPSDGGHTAFGDIYYSESPDLAPFHELNIRALSGAFAPLRETPEFQVGGKKRPPL